MRTLSVICLIITISACKVGPRDIEYGYDVCHYCKMTVVNNQHAAQSVTDKGKIYTYDALECMVNHINDQEDRSYSFLLVNDYSNPGNLIDVQGATFLISKKIPSPMGAYLSAYENESVALQMQNDKSGDIYNWDQLGDLFKKEKRTLMESRQPSLD